MISGVTRTAFMGAVWGIDDAHDVWRGVMVTANASINGTALPTHPGGYLPFTYELTPFLK